MVQICYNGIMIEIGSDEFLGLDPRDQLLELIRQIAVVHGSVTLASGKEAEYYVDLRRVTLHHLGAPLVGHQLLDMLEERGFVPAQEWTAIGGLTLGADPIADAVLHAANSRAIEVDAFVVRKNVKDHGMQRQIEGPDIANKNVIIVEDTTTTGGSPITAIEAVRAAGANPIACATIVDRSTGAAAKIEALGVPYFSLFTLDDLDL
ncbi:orotate phosphoribosyltransferase [Actinomycetota bacterium]|nr:orotate phosphoribosyltransferase [Actinomycetota bacterium]